MKPLHKTITTCALAVSGIAVIALLYMNQNLLVIAASVVSFLGTLTAALGRSVLSKPPEVPAGGILMANLLKQLGLALVTFGETELEQFKPQIVSSLQNGGVQATQYISTQLKTQMKSNSLLGKIEEPVLDGIATNLATQAIAGMGGESEALFAIVDHELHVWAASLGGK